MTNPLDKQRQIAPEVARDGEGAESEDELDAHDDLGTAKPPKRKQSPQGEGAWRKEDFSKNRTEGDPR